MDLIIHLILLKIAKSFKMFDFLGVAENTEKYIFCFYIIFFCLGKVWKKSQTVKRYSKKDLLRFINSARFMNASQDFLLNN